MFSFLKKSAPKYTNYSVLGLDFHSHLIPGIDDGADSLETSLSLIRQLHEMGYHRLIATPHVISDLYPNTSADITRRMLALRQAVHQAGIPVEIDAAAEYYMDETFNNLITEDQELLALPGKRVLVEMSFVSAPPGLFHYIFRLQTRGYRPILAHPERYLFLKKDFSLYQRLKEYGCEFQLNLLSLTGHYGAPVMEAAHKLLKKQLIDYACTDLHHQRHIELLKQALQDKQIQRLLATYPFRNTEMLNPDFS